MKYSWNVSSFITTNSTSLDLWTLFFSQIPNTFKCIGGKREKKKTKGEEEISRRVFVLSRRHHRRHRWTTSAQQLASVRFTSYLFRRWNVHHDVVEIIFPAARGYTSTTMKDVINNIWRYPNIYLSLVRWEFVDLYNTTTEIKEILCLLSELSYRSLTNQPYQSRSLIIDYI